jgi:hypothetical protein
MGLIRRNIKTRIEDPRMYDLHQRLIASIEHHLAYRCSEEQLKCMAGLKWASSPFPPSRTLKTIEIPRLWQCLPYSHPEFGRPAPRWIKVSIDRMG